MRGGPAWIVAACLLAAAGCREELGPERFEVTAVRGRVTLGDRPVAGGFIEFQPIDGTRGNLRSGPIAPDGTFELDGVPVGRVAVGLTQIPVGAIPTVAGPFNPRLFGQGAPIRRSIPPGRGAPAQLPPIDLMIEAARLNNRRAPGRRRRRSERPERNATRPPAEVLGAAIPPKEGGALTIRVVHRDGAGATHLDWPIGRLAEALADAEGSTWVDVEDLDSGHNAEVEALFRDPFRFHPLAIEDALKDVHVPRVDDWGKYLYLIVDTIDFHPETDELQLHELDVFLGCNYLLTYRHEPIEVVDRHRLLVEREPDERLKHGPSHLLYHLLDDVVAEFLPAIEHLDDAIDDAQDEVFDHATPGTLRRIFHVKGCALRLHRVVTPMREVLNRLARDPYAQVKAEHRVYFRDVYDHLVRVHDIVESLRDLIGGALDTYLSIVSNRTNDIMKVLTLLNVMFLPMTFIAGFFGMNFFGETLMFVAPALPKAALFWGAVATMAAAPAGMWLLARRLGWF